MLYRYEMTANPIWWPDIVQVKDRQKYVTCRSKTEQKTFNIKVSTCTTFLSFFFSVRPLSVLRGHSVFSSPPQQPMTETSKDFYTRSYPLHYFLILFLEKEPVFPFSMLSAKQGLLVPFL